MGQALALPSAFLTAPLPLVSVSVVVFRRGWIQRFRRQRVWSKCHPCSRTGTYRERRNPAEQGCRGYHLRPILATAIGAVPYAGDMLPLFDAVRYRKEGKPGRALLAVAESAAGVALGPALDSAKYLAKMGKSAHAGESAASTVIVAIAKRTEKAAEAVLFLNPVSYLIVFTSLLRRQLC